MVIGETAGDRSSDPLPEEASETSDSAVNAELSSDLSNTIFADVRVGGGLIATYSFESFEDLNASLVAFLAALQVRGVRSRFKPRLSIEESFPE